MSEMPETGREETVDTLGIRIDALDRHVSSEFAGLKELMASQRLGDQLALKTALDASQELAAKHNDLIRQQERKDALYATKVETDRLASWQAKITGGLIVVGAIGVVNLTKLWFG